MSSSSSVNEVGIGGGASGPSDALVTGAVIAIAIAGALALVCCSGVAFYFFMYRRRGENCEAAAIGMALPRSMEYKYDSPVPVHSSVLIESPHTSPYDRSGVAAPIVLNTMSSEMHIATLQNQRVVSR